MKREQLEQRLQAYLDAEAKILQSQEYTIGDGGTARRNKRAELATVQAEIAKLQTQLAQADSAVHPRILYVR
jgi:hypothetical protein